MTTRSEKRAGFGELDRIKLLEDDADKMDVAMTGVQDQLKKLTQAAVGAVIGFATSAVLLAINLAVAA